MIVVAIDGPSGAGKSSTSKLVATRAGWDYLDTGALYRAVAWLALREKISSAEDILAALSNNTIHFISDPKSPKVFVGDVDVTTDIRNENVTSTVSAISALPEIRASLLTLQRKLINDAERGIVVEGRDIGTVVAPDAPLKIYLQADIAARAARRSSEISAPVAIVSTSLSERDEIDSTRAVSPLVKASDAVLIDSTELDLEETVERVWELLKERSLLGLPIVAILGRPNVGKSTLINR
jgi:GTP-binding protein